MSKTKEKVEINGVNCLYNVQYMEKKVLKGLQS